MGRVDKPDASVAICTLDRVVFGDMNDDDIRILRQLGIKFVDTVAGRTEACAALKSKRVFYHPDKWQNGKPAAATDEQAAGYKQTSDLLNMHYDRLRSLLAAPSATGMPAFFSPMSSTKFFEASVPETTHETLKSMMRGFSERRVRTPPTATKARPPVTPRPKVAPRPTACRCATCQRNVCLTRTAFELEFADTDTSGKCHRHLVSTRRVAGNCVSVDVLKRLRLTKFAAVRTFLNLPDASWREIIPVPGNGEPVPISSSLFVGTELEVTE